MTAVFELELLNTSAAAELQVYEHAFFEAFKRAKGNRLIRQLWLFDDASDRLATRIPYDEQLVYVMRDTSAAIIAGMGVNTAMRSFQGASFGFRPENPAGCCELLTMFSLGEYRLEKRFRFYKGVFADLRKRGFHTAYATTAQRPLQTYVRSGGRILEEKEIEGEMRYFLRFDLT